MPDLSKAMLDELVRREIAKRPPVLARMAPRPAESSSKPITPLDPAIASVGGAALDALSTYRFLKRGTSTEDNAMFSGMGPLSTAGLVGTIGPLSYYLLKRVSPKLARVFGSQMGSQQLALGALNFDVDKDVTSSNKLDQKLNLSAPRK